MSEEIKQGEINDFDGVETIPTDVIQAQSDGAGSGAAAPETETFDESDYLKNLGFESVDAIKAQQAELLELRKFKETAAQTPAFANPESEKFYSYFKDGKEEDLLKHLSDRVTLSKMTNADATKLADAAQIIKLNMQFSNRDLTPDEVDYLFNKKYSLPEKPVQGADQEDDDYQRELATWNKQVSITEKEMIIDAKQAKPQLAKYQTELVLPDIQRVDPNAQAAAQKELETNKAYVTDYLSKVDGLYKSFNGYNATFKDKEVELGIGYTVTDEEKAAVKTVLDSFASENGYGGYFGKRWFDEKENPRIEQIMSDIYLLENQEKVFQKMVNEAAAKRLEHYLKTKSNIRIQDGPSGSFQPDDAKARQEKELEFLMEA